MVSGILKIPSLTSFELYVFSFGLASFDLCSIAARLLVVFEVTLGLWIFSGVARKWSNLCCAATLAAFSAFLVWRLVVGDNTSCHCFGDFVDMKAGMSLVKNAVLGAMLAFCWKTGFTQSFSFLYIPAAAIIVGAAVFLTNPMDMQKRGGDNQSSVSTPLWEEFASSRELQGRKIVAFYSTGCRFCANCISKISGIVMHNGIDPDAVYNIFIAPNGFEKESVLEFYKTNGNSLMSRFELLEPKPFLQLTDGAMPIVLLCEDGVIVREYDYLNVDEKEIASFLNNQ